MKNIKWGYFRHLLRQHRAVIILYFILAIFGYPIQTWMRWQGGEQIVIAYAGRLPQLIALPSLPLQNVMLGIVLAFITPFIVFHYLYQRPALDTYYALPVRRDALFGYHLVFGLAIILAPLLLAHLLGYGVLKILAARYATCYSLHYPFLEWLLQALALVGGMAVIFLPTVLAILCTTNLFNGFVYGGILHLFPLTVLILWQGVCDQVIGYAHRGIDALHRLANWGEYHLVFFNGALQPRLYWKPLLLWMGLSALLLLGCVWLIRHRRTERIDSAEMFRWFYPIVLHGYGLLLLTLWMVSGTTGSFGAFLVRPRTWMPYIFFFFGGLILYFIAQIIRAHGFPPILRTFGKYLLVFGCSALLAFGLKGPLPEWISMQTVDPARVAKIDIIVPEIAETKEGYVPVRNVLDTLEEWKDQDLELPRALLEEVGADLYGARTSSYAADTPVPDALRQPEISLDRYPNITTYTRFFITDPEQIRRFVEWQKETVQTIRSENARVVGPLEYRGVYLDSITVYIVYRDAQGAALQTRQYIPARQQGQSFLDTCFPKSK